MKILIFSDTHFSTKVDQSRLDYILKLIDSVDQVIINGDFWDYFLCYSFDNFVKSGWNQLFAALKKKNTIYIYGNHNEKELHDNRVELFSVEQAHKYYFQSGPKLLSVQHGHLEVPKFDGSHPELIHWLMSHVPFLVKWFVSLALSPISQHWLQMKYHIISQVKLRQYVKVQLASSQNEPNKANFYIFGHCHLPFFSQSEKICIVGGFLCGQANYLIIEDGQMTHFHEKYE